VIARPQFGCVLGTGVSPLAQGAQDQALRLAVGPRRRRLGAAMDPSQAATQASEGPRAVGAVLVGQDLPESDTEPGLMAYGLESCPTGAAGGLVGRGRK
jgi:hypothetical protein